MKSSKDKSRKAQREPSTPGVRNELESRIQKSREAIANYPAWVRKGMFFQGGGVRRDDPEEPFVNPPSTQTGF